MNDVLIILVCYKVDLSSLSLLQALHGADILVYDNSPKKQEKSGDYIYVHDPSNPGVSRAYNYGIDLARKMNKKYVLLLDHDTKFDMGSLEEYMRLSAKYGEDYLYAPIISGNGKIYSPFIETRVRNLVQTDETFTYEEKYSLEDKSLINSGLMIPLKVIDRIGGFNERIKLDFSDIYFISKYKRVMKEVILVRINMGHGLSGDEGYDRKRELDRFRYYCNGAREFKKSSGFKLKLNLFVLFRTLRLVMKYKVPAPLGIALKYYTGEETI